MRIRKLIGSILMCAGLAWGGSATAALVSADLTSAGDGLLTVDTGTMLQWLDVTQTGNLSYNQILSGAGGFTTTLGFRYAAMTEVRAFFTNAGFTDFSYVFYQSQVQPAQSLIAQIGTLGPEFMEAIVPDANGHLSTAEINWSPSPLSRASFVRVRACDGCIGRQWYDYDASPNLGSFLVRDVAAIPEPETYAMMLAGLGLLGFMARRRKQEQAA